MDKCKVIAVTNQKCWQTVVLPTLCEASHNVGNGKKVIMKSRVIKRLGIKGILLNNLA